MRAFDCGALWLVIRGGGSEEACCPDWKVKLLHLSWMRVISWRAGQSPDEMLSAKAMALPSTGASPAHPMYDTIG